MAAVWASPCALNGIDFERKADVDEDLHQRMDRIRAERTRILQEEETLRKEAQLELDRVVAEMERLEAKREALESFL